MADDRVKPDDPERFGRTIGENVTDAADEEFDGTDDDIDDEEDEDTVEGA